MALKSGECVNPPHIKSLKVLEIGDSFAVVHWNTSFSPPRQIYKYSYKLNWKIHGQGKQSSRMSNSASSSLILPSSQQSMVLANLRPISNYSLSLFSFSQCARSPTINVKVTTRNPALVHQAVTKILPIEICLIVLVLLIWVLIMHQFLRLYKRITLVNTMPMGGYYNGHKKDSRVSAASRLSNASAISKSSNINQFDILEDAVCAWRSETVLSRKFQRSEPQYPSNENRETSLIPDVFPKKTYSRSAKTSLSYIRRSSGVSLTAPVSSTRLRSDSQPKDHLALSVQAYKPIPQVTINDQAKGIIQTSNSLPILRKLNVYEKPLPSLLLPFTQENKEEETKVEKQRTASTISNQRRVSTNPYVLLPAGPLGGSGPPRRKISQVVLGKATKDIRRCSSFAGINPMNLAFARKASAKRTSLRRRLSSINITLQKKFR